MSWRYLKSFVSETVLERTSSPYNEELEVWYIFGKNVLNAKTVNYSYGLLGKVFRSAFSQLKVEQRKVQEVLILGLGVGNVVSLLSQYGQKIHFTGIEIDAEVIRLGNAHFELDAYKNLEIIVGDALEYVQTCDKKFDLIIVDLFVDDKVPAQVEEPAFFEQLEAILGESGLLIWNRLAFSDEILQHTKNFIRRMQIALPGSKVLRAHKNRIVYYEK